jgi:hypothetical protein
VSVFVALEARSCRARSDALRIVGRVLRARSRCDSRARGAYLDGTGATTDADHDVIAHALNETFAERGRDHPMPYRR